MPIDFKKIKELREQVEKGRNEEKKIVVAKFAQESEKLNKSIEQSRQQSYENVDNIIANLQTKIEEQTKAGFPCNLDLLKLGHYELRCKPQEYFFFDKVRVGKYLKLSRGYKPNCLPDYARKLYDYCRKSGLITLINKSPNKYEREWQFYKYVITIYW